MHPAGTDGHTRRAPRNAAVLLAFATTACDSPVAPLRPPITDLPPDLAALTFTTTGSPTLPFTMLEVRTSNSFNGFVAIDGAGRPVWYFRTVGGPLSFTRRANGNFVVLDSQRGLFEVSPDGDVVHFLAQETSPGRHIHHDVLATAQNTILLIAEEWREWNGQPLSGEAIWEWVPETGETTRRWSAFDHLDPVVDRGPRSRPDDWLHANSLSRGPRGNLLLSLHFLNQVLSITPDFQSLEWRLGGIRASIPVDDPFSGQHTAAEVSANRVLLFDNGFEREDERYSRAAEYEIRGDHAVLSWQWRPQRDNWARVISGAHRLSNGNTLVAFGTPRDLPPGSTGPIEVYEVTRAGRVVWHVAVDGRVSSIYRATPLARFQD